MSYNIKIGIKTYGPPLLEKAGDFTLIHNLLIGDKFHWETCVEAMLPGELKAIGCERSVNKDGAVEDQCNDSITLINEVPLETYLECVVGSEMNPDAPLEFLKAQAIVSRSWAFGKILGAHKYDNSCKIISAQELYGWDDDIQHIGFHVCSDDHCQRYQGKQPISSEARKAIQETEGVVIADSKDRIIDARFSKCCGGHTEEFSTCWQDVNPECLEGFEDPWCDISKIDIRHRERILKSILKDYDLITSGYGYTWNGYISREEIKQNLNQKFSRDVGDILSLQPLRRGVSGRISRLQISGTKGDLILGKELWIRRLLSPNHLYSSAVTLKEDNKGFFIEGKGWGHGVGLCQIGAANMAIKGYRCEDILAFYYPGSRLIQLQ